MDRTKLIPYWRGIAMFLRDPKADWKPKVLALLAVVYLIWPVDLVPDFLPLFGWLEDLGFSGLAAWYLLRTANRYLEEQKPD